MQNQFGRWRAFDAESFGRAEWRLAELGFERLVRAVDAFTVPGLYTFTAGWLAELVNARRAQHAFSR